jgi:hypothetical protein
MMQGLEIYTHGAARHLINPHVRAVGVPPHDERAGAAELVRDTV